MRFGMGERATRKRMNAGELKEARLAMFEKWIDEGEKRRGEYELTSHGRDDEMMGNKSLAVYSLWYL